MYKAMAKIVSVLFMGMVVNMVAFVLPVVKML